MDSSSDDDDVFNFKKRAAAVARNTRGSPLDEEDDESDSDNSETSNCSHQKPKKIKLLDKYKSWDENDDDRKEVADDNHDKQASNKEVLVTLDSDDSDIEHVEMLPWKSTQTTPISTNIAVSSLDEETQKTLQKAKEARIALEKSVDIDVESSEDDVTIIDAHPLPHKQHGDDKRQGPILSLKLRTNIKRGTSSSHGSTDYFTMYENDTFASLLEKYRSKFKLSPSDVVEMSFDGQALNLRLTPRDLDMEDEDLVDVSLKQVTALKGSNQVQTYRSTAPVDHHTITVVSRVKGGDSRITHNYILKMSDPFRKLLNSYRSGHGYSSIKPVSLEYNGKPLDPDCSPGGLNMKGEVQIEIIDTEEKLKQLERCGKLLDTLSDNPCVKSSSNTISLKLRITNKGEKNMTEQTYELGMNESFKILINQFIEKNNVTEKECKFTFDGVNLSLNGTPEDEGLEGGEIIDVSVDRTVKSSSDIVMNIVSNIAGSSTNQPAAKNGPQSNSNTPSHGRTISVNTIRNNVSATELTNVLLHSQTVNTIFFLQLVWPN